MQRSLFGDDLTDYEIDVIIDSGLARAQWETITRQMAAERASRDTRSWKNRIRQVLKLAGAGAAVLPQLTRLTYNWASKRVKDRTDQKRLRVDEIEPEDPDAKRIKSHGSFANLHSQATMSDSFTQGMGSGNSAGLKETPIDRVKNVERGPRDYQFASLPWAQQELRAVDAWHWDVSYRMTSPYDPQVNWATAVDLNAGSGAATSVTSVTTDLANEGGSSARFFDFYQSLYNYYTVVSAKWHLTFENLCPEPVWVHQLYYNDVLPPVEATNEDIMCWKDAESHYVGSHHLGVGVSTGSVLTNEMIANVPNIEGGGPSGGNPNFNTGNMISSRGISPILKLSGKYSPGDFKRQIRLDSEVENWTLTNANPALPERLLFRVRPICNALDVNDANTYNRPLRFRYTIKIDYLVEFKELKSYLRWPIERQPLYAVITSNAEEDDEP